MSEVYDKIIDHPGAWTSAERPTKKDFQHDLSAPLLDAFDSMLKKVEAVAAEDITRAQFDHPAINKFAGDLFADVQDGRGLAYVEALPLDRYSHRQMAKIFWGLGTHMGNAVSQSVLGDRLGSIKNESDKDPEARAYHRTIAIIPVCIFLLGAGIVVVALGEPGVPVVCCARASSAPMPSRAEVASSVRRNRPRRATTDFFT